MNPSVRSQEPKLREGDTEQDAKSGVENVRRLTLIVHRHEEWETHRKTQRAQSSTAGDQPLRLSKCSNLTILTQALCANVRAPPASASARHRSCAASSASSSQPNACDPPRGRPPSRAN